MDAVEQGVGALSGAAGGGLDRVFFASGGVCDALEQFEQVEVGVARKRSGVPVGSDVRQLCNRVAEHHALEAPEVALSQRRSFDARRPGQGTHRERGGAPVSPGVCERDGCDLKACAPQATPERFGARLALRGERRIAESLHAVLQVETGLAMPGENHTGFVWRLLGKNFPLRHLFGPE